MFQISGENSKPFAIRVCTQGEWQKYTHPSPPLSKDKGLKGIGHSMSTINLILGANSVTVPYFICYDSLLQNVTDIISKWNSYLSQNTTEVYDKMH